MSQTLDSTLAAAQTAIDRKPIVKITSEAAVGDIPFPGLPMPAYPMAYRDEMNPYAIPLSGGEVAFASLYGSGTGSYPNYTYLRLIVTTGERSYFNEPVILPLTNYSPEVNTRRINMNGISDGQVSIVELPNGDLGVAWLDVGYTTYPAMTLAFHAAEITTAGIQVYPATANLGTGTTKESYSGNPDGYMSGPSTIRLANGTYLSVFVHNSDGTNYIVYKKTSSDFRTWAARSAVTLPGVDTTKQIANVSIVQIANGDVILAYDYTEEVGGNGERLRNIYYSVSSDNGATWSAPIKVTDYDSFQKTALHPVIVQRAGGEINLAYAELVTCLAMGTSTLGWPDGPDPTGGQGGEALSWDPIHRKLYVVNGTQSGNGSLENIVKIDVDTWTIDNAWTGRSTPGSVPSFPYPWGTMWERTRNDKHLVAVLREMGLDILDGEADTITTYQFWEDYITPVVKNTTGWPIDVSNWPMKCQVDADAMRVYLFGWNGYPYHPDGAVGYIDLTDPGPNYEVNMIFDERNWGVDTIESLGVHDGDFLVVPSADMIFITWVGTLASGGQGGLRIYQLSTGARIAHIQWENNKGFPWMGLYDICYKDGKLYGNFPYIAQWEQVDRRGIVEINLTDYSCIYYRPSYATKDDYRLFGPRVLASGEILFEGWNGEGVVLWDPASSKWTQYTSATVPGLSYDSWTGNVMYDELTGTIFANCNGGGLRAFNRDGFLYRSQIVEGNYTTEWEFGVPQFLTMTWQSYDAALVVMSDDSLVSFWSNSITPGYLTTVWGVARGTVDLTSFIARGHDISFARSIDGKPNSLEFMVTHGHLFDPTNRWSLWQTLLKKMRKLTLSFGERINGVDYWHPQGEFFVRETEVQHRRGEYPLMRVKAEDIRCLLEDMYVSATPHYEEYPEDLIKMVLEDDSWGPGIAPSDIDLPTFREDWRYVVWIQWLDTSIKKMVDQIATRFGYAISVGTDGKIGALKISLSNAVSHDYMGGTPLLVDWTPDDSFSDFTNRVTVVGESRDFMEVLYEEELIKQLMGTVGWWGHKTTMRIYYSEDNSRRCRYPRLDILESVRNFNFRLGGGGESMTAVDEDERWVEITVDMPNLTSFVVADCIALIALGYEAIVVSGLTGCPGWIVFAITILLSALFYVVSSIAQYQYSLYARPVGHERMSIQSAPPHGDDIVLQTEMRRIIEKKIDEPLCITALQCNQYADYELAIVQAQRNRVKFSKIAHLQDDEGDTINVPQPYTMLAQKIFITDLKRKMKIPADPDSTGDGYFIDEIEGWAIQ